MAKQNITATHCYLTEDGRYVSISYDRDGQCEGKAFPRGEFEAFLAAEGELDWQEFKEVLGVEEWFLMKHEPGHRLKIATLFIERMYSLQTSTDKVFPAKPFDWMKAIARPSAHDDCDVKGWTYSESAGNIRISRKACGAVETDDVDAAEFARWLASKGVSFGDWMNTRITCFKAQCRSLYSYLQDLNEYYHDLANNGAYSDEV